MLANDDRLESPTARQPTCAAHPVFVPLLLYTGILLPIQCFWVVWHGEFIEGPSWQSGQPDDYASLFLMRETTIVFYPLLVFAMVSYLLLLMRPRRWADRSAARLGLYSGIPLAWQYTLVHVVLIEGGNPWSDVVMLWIKMFATLTLIPATVLLAAGAVWQMVRKRLTSQTWMRWSSRLERGLSILFLAGFLVLATMTMDVVPRDLQGLQIMVSVYAPFWTLGSYIWMTWRIQRFRASDSRLSLRYGFLILTWLVAYFAALRQAFASAMELYAKLPKEGSNCYVATAAARGHRCWVGSFRVDAGPQGDGGICINRQLLRIKAGEILCAILFPRLHRRVRKIYDYWGPRWAKGLTSPWRADLVYLLLKPLEWMAMAVTLPWRKTVAATIDRLRQPSAG